MMNAIVFFCPKSLIDSYIIKQKYYQLIKPMNPLKFLRLINVFKFIIVKSTNLYNKYQKLFLDNYENKLILIF